MRLAARGSRDLDGGEEPIGDAAGAAELRRRAVRVNAEALLLAFALTAAGLLAPV